MKFTGFLLWCGLMLSATGSAAITADHQEENAIQERWKAFIAAWEKEDAEACARIYMPNGINVPPQMQMNEGRENIGTFYAWLFSMNRTSKYRHFTSQLHISNGMAVEYASFEVHWTPHEGEPWTYFGRCMVHWLKDEDGLWYIAGFYFNNPPQAD